MARPTDSGADSEVALRARRCATSGLVIGLALALYAAPGMAADGEPIHLFYRTPSGCPEEGALVEQIKSRAQVRRAAADESARAFFFEVSRRGPTFHGLLTVRDLDGTDTERAVSAARCDEVVTALALIAALAVEVRARTPVEHRPAPVAPPLPPPQPPTVTPPPVVVPVAPAPGASWHWGLGGSFEGQAGPAPGPLWGVGVFAEGGLRFGRWTPHVRLGALHFPPGLTNLAQGGRAAFSLTTARLEVCPVRWTWSRASVDPCARLDAGSLLAEGLDVPNAQSQRRPWVASGLAGHLTVQVFRSLYAGLDVNLGAQWVRDRFLIGSESVIHEPSPWGYGGALVLGMSNW